MLGVQLEVPDGDGGATDDNEDAVAGTLEPGTMLLTDDDADGAVVAGAGTELIGACTTVVISVVTGTTIVTIDPGVFAGGKEAEFAVVVAGPAAAGGVVVAMVAGATGEEEEEAVGAAAIGAGPERVFRRAGTPIELRVSLSAY